MYMMMMMMMMMMMVGDGWLLVIGRMSVSCYIFR